MNSLVAIVLVAGCAETNTQTGGSEPGIVNVDQKWRMVAAREKQCIDEALARGRDETERIVGIPDPSIALQVEQEADERDREISLCRAAADNEAAEISERERNEYQVEAQQESNRASFMAIVTAPTH